MIKEFPYIYEKGKFHPLIPVIVGDQIATLALVDSGTELSLFRQEVAEEPGIEIEKGEKTELSGIGGRIIIYKHTVPIRVGGIIFKCKIAFSREFTASINILGRNNFFHHFVVKFDELKRITCLEPRKC